MEHQTDDLISMIKEALPLSMFFRRNELVEDRDRKLMAEIGLSRSSYLNLLGEFEGELGVKIPEKVARRYKFFPRTILKFLPPRKVCAWEFGDIPDMSINELAAIVDKGYWPAEFFRDAFPEAGEKQGEA